MCDLGESIERHGIELGFERDIETQVKIVDGFMKKMNIFELSDAEKRAIRSKLQ